IGVSADVVRHGESPLIYPAAQSVRAVTRARRRAMWRPAVRLRVLDQQQQSEPLAILVQPVGSLVYVKVRPATPACSAWDSSASTSPEGCATRVASTGRAGSRQ